MPFGLLGLSRKTMFNIYVSLYVNSNQRRQHLYAGTFVFCEVVTMCSVSVFDRAHDDDATTHIGLCKLHKYRVADNGNDVIDSMNSIHKNASTSIQLYILLVCIELRMERQRVLESPKITSYSIVSRDDGLVFQWWYGRTHWRAHTHTHTKQDSQRKRFSQTNSCVKLFAAVLHCCGSNAKRQSQMNLLTRKGLHTPCVPICQLQFDTVQWKGGKRYIHCEKYAIRLII